MAQWKAMATETEQAFTTDLTTAGYFLIFSYLLPVTFCSNCFKFNCKGTKLPDDETEWTFISTYLVCIEADHLFSKFWGGLNGKLHCKIIGSDVIDFFRRMGLVRITSWYPNSNGSHFGLPPSEIHGMTGLPSKIVWTQYALFAQAPSDGAKVRGRNLNGKTVKPTAKVKSHVRAFVTSVVPPRNHARSHERFDIIGSAEALPILCVRYFRWERERERERYRERRKWRHHFRAKIGDEFTLSLAKNSHNWRWAYTFPCQKFALFVSPFTLPVSPFTEWPRGHHCGAEIRNEFTLSIAKNFFALFAPPLSNAWHEPRDEWSKTQDKWSNPGQSYFVLPIEKMTQINTKNYWK